MSAKVLGIGEGAVTQTKHLNESAIVLEWITTDIGAGDGRHPTSYWWFPTVEEAREWGEQSSHLINNRIPHYTEIWSQSRGLIWVSAGDGLPPPKAGTQTGELVPLNGKTERERHRVVEKTESKWASLYEVKVLCMPQTLSVGRKWITEGKLEATDCQRCVNQEERMTRHG